MKKLAANFVQEETSSSSSDSHRIESPRVMNRVQCKKIWDNSATRSSESAVIIYK